jgi:hypothetical protein
VRFVHQPKQCSVLAPAYRLMIELNHPQPRFVSKQSLDQTTRQPRVG